jgi:CubicO group peptidase (beta-lactamase class C family)
MALLADPLRDRLAPLFHENFEKFGELGAAVSIWHKGESILDLSGGFRDARREQAWTEETIVLVWSATKGIGSACLLHAFQENKIDLERRVMDFWPEFGQNGKHTITIAELASHSAGLCALDHSAEITDYDSVIRAIEKQNPLWPPGTAHGYHARTFGFLVDELVRRITSISIARYWRQTFAEPLSLDFWIGLPAELNNRCATVYAAKGKRPPEPAKFYRDLTTPGTLQQKTFTSPRGLHSVSEMNQPALRALPVVSFGGIGSASALAKFYGMLANGGELDGHRFFSENSLRMMTTHLADGVDSVFEIPTAFSAGLMKDSLNGRRRIFGPSGKAFGHPGAGGSHAFADPENRISFAYVMNQMEQTLLPNEKSLRLVDAIYR